MGLAENVLSPLSQSTAAQYPSTKHEQLKARKQARGSMGMEQFLRMSAVQAEAAMKPQLVAGKWKQPLISGRKVALIKKHAVRNGLVGRWVEGQGGWLETWDRAEKHHVMRPPKGHLNQRNEFDRVKKIQAALAAMPAKIAEHKKAVKASKPLKGLDKWLNETDPY